MAANPVGLVLIDDHSLFRAALAELLGTVLGYAVLGEGASGDEAAALAREHRPDVVMLAAELPGPGVGSTISQILRESPQTKVVVLTSRDDPDSLRQVFDAGAAAFLTKTAGRAELIAAIDSARREQDGFLLATSRATVSAVIHRRVVTRAVTLSSPLTAQESRVLELLAQGQPNRRISVELFISETTVKRHLTNIYRKLNVTSRLQAVTKAGQIGLLRARPGS
jgi:DNA-binding NarL/FixJ family response regulator